MIRRMIVYIDGFNLYYGMRDARLKRFYWLDLWKFAQEFVPPGSELVGVKYFTAMVVPPPWDKDKLLRQQTYIDALRTLDRVEIFRGHHMRIIRTCPNCRAEYSTFEEKSTDVSIASQMIADSFENKHDDLILVSGDGDLREPLRLIHQRFPQKKLIIVFPPNRSCGEFKRLAKMGVCRCLYANRTSLRRSQFPDTVVGITGHPLIRPRSWK